MNDPFFINKGAPTKRKRPAKPQKRPATTSKRTADEEIDESDVSDNDRREILIDEEIETESADAKRLRLSRAYLDKLEHEEERVADQIDAAELDREIIASRLQQDAVCLCKRAMANRA